MAPRLGAQASLPASFGQSVIAGNQAGKDACAPRRHTLGLRFSLFHGVATPHERSSEVGGAPRKFALPSRRDFHFLSKLYDCVARWRNVER
jgi:hypothetical protein